MQVNGPEGQKEARKKSLAVSVACMVIYCPTKGLKGRTFKLCVLTRRDFNFCVRRSPLRGCNSRNYYLFRHNSMASVLVLLSLKGFSTCFAMAKGFSTCFVKAPRIQNFFCYNSKDLVLVLLSLNGFSACFAMIQWIQYLFFVCFL